MRPEEEKGAVMPEFRPGPARRRNRGSFHFGRIFRLAQAGRRSGLKKERVVGGGKVFGLSSGVAQGR